MKIEDTIVAKLTPEDMRNAVAEYVRCQRPDVNVATVTFIIDEGDDAEYTVNNLSSKCTCTRVEVPLMRSTP